jgi:methionyl-tRNA formyltransferase
VSDGRVTRIVAIYLMDQVTAERANSHAAAAGLAIDVRVATCLDELERAAQAPFDMLLSFGTSVIVPPGILGRYGSLPINLHAAPPSYPGRDPHHFAVYDGARTYGATLHFMLPRVDAGPIIDVELFDVGDAPAPIDLLERACAAGWVVLKRFFAAIVRDGLERINANPAYQWGPRKHTRADFRALCRIDCAVDEAELARRVRAASMPGYNNLTLELFGHVFRIDGCSE